MRHCLRRGIMGEHLPPRMHPLGENMYVQGLHSGWAFDPLDHELPPPTSLPPSTSGGGCDPEGSTWTPNKFMVLKVVVWGKCNGFVVLCGDMYGGCLGLCSGGVVSGCYVYDVAGAHHVINELCIGNRQHAGRGDLFNPGCDGSPKCHHIPGRRLKNVMLW